MNSKRTFKALLVLSLLFPAVEALAYCKSSALLGINGDHILPDLPQRGSLGPLRVAGIKPNYGTHFEIELKNSSDESFSFKKNDSFILSETQEAVNEKVPLYWGTKESLGHVRNQQQAAEYTFFTTDRSEAAACTTQYGSGGTPTAPWSSDRVGNILSMQHGVRTSKSCSDANQIPNSNTIFVFTHQTNPNIQILVRCGFNCDLNGTLEKLGEVTSDGSTLLRRASWLYNGDYTSLFNIQCE